MKEHLAGRIVQDGFVSTGGRLPSEVELAVELGVSRSTVREALAMLAREGLVIRRHGIGTFANTNLPGLQTSFSEVVEFEDLIAQQGYQASARVLRAGVEAAGSLAQQLHLKAVGEEVFIVEKIFTANQVPVIFCRNAIPLRLVLAEHRDRVADPVAWRKPIYRFLLEYCEQDTIYHVSRVNAAVAEAELARHLECAVSQPLLCIEEVGFNQEQEPILYSLEYYRDQIVRFHAIRKVVRPFSWEQNGR